MSLSSTTNRNDYLGNNTTPVYPYTFKVFKKEDIRVVERNLSGVEFVLVLDVDYTVSGVKNPSGGFVTRTAGNLPTGFKWTIRRVVDLTQETDIRNQGDFLPEAHEDQYDLLVMADQQQQDEIDRSLKLSVLESGSPAATAMPSLEDRQSKFLAFDASGNPIAAAGIPSAPVSSFMETFVDDTNASNGLTTLRDNLSAETNPEPNDEVFLRDTSALAVDRIALSDLFKVITDFASEPDPDPTDELLLYDTGAGTAEKLALSTLYTAAFKAIDAQAVETSPAVDDKLALFDQSAGTGDKIRLDDMLKVVASLPEDTDPSGSADFILTSDTSAGAAKKVKLNKAGQQRFVAGISVPAVATTSDFTITLGAFDPPLPAGTTSVPVIEVVITRVDNNYPGNTSAAAHNMGFLNSPGTPFGGTSPVEGHYKNANINDKIRFSTGGNAAASVSGTFKALIIAVI